MIEPTLRLADAIHDWSFGRKTWHGHAIPETCLALQARYRGKLRDAQHWVLDDDATRLICHFAHEADRFDAWSVLARLPYRHMFVEFNLHVKVGEFAAMNKLPLPFKPDEVAPRLGLLFYPDGDHASRWLCQSFYEWGDHGVMPGMFVYVFDPEGDTFQPVKGSTLWRVPTLSLLSGFPKLPIDVRRPGAAAGEWVVEHTAVDPEYAFCGIFEGGAEGSKVHVPEWFVAKSAVVVDPWWWAFFARRRAEGEEERARLNKLLLHQAREETGALRWVIAMLAAINGVPRDVRPLATRTGHRMVNMHKLPFFRQSVVRLEVPREDRIVYARKHLDESASFAHRPRHSVRGFWRIVERGKRPPYQCRHIPVLAEDGLAICSKCELLIRWIEDFERGDSSLGYVYHTYSVEGKRQTIHVPPKEEAT